ncbi:putative enzyme related to lactoylglutathione lyase [Paenibacillus cellulosilyticus]|uniref:Putative enzyme related to lactoylglutathione lyase n=1 Tax=Paenibacillus cellulosilyticus TaxID=375489 RepID=A0A2V2YVI2_9BACL|nr:VOC family protein [Paenibacillus cellulosilyticus]PWV94452.1 putative enzyme related to lactoylglutathione lyase [Paenibacillus cellulosilyticus]QKS44972.1 VOC family protein [Paenibacillus cellulosilyticus]
MTNEIKVINNQIHFVFVPVKNMENAVKFYSSILGLTIKPGPYENIYNLDIPSPNIVLDSNLEEGFVPAKHPLFTFVANDLNRAQQLITEAGGFVRDIVSFDDLSFFVFDDLDGNRITIVNR